MNKSSLLFLLCKVIIKFTFVLLFLTQMKHLNSLDKLFFGYFLLSTLPYLFSWNGSSSLVLLLVRVGLAAFALGLIFMDAKPKGGIVSFLRSTYPLVFSGYFYSETFFHNKFLFSDFDPYLVKAEAFLFGCQPSVLFSQIIPSKLFSELMYLGYFSFYLIIFGFTLFLYFKNRQKFYKGVFLLSASLYIFYLIFSVFPSAGPQFYFITPDNILPEAYLFGWIMHLIQLMAEQPTGAFPSSHVGVSLIILVLSRKYIPTFYKIVWPFVLILVFSTVYIKAHYVIDVLAGMVSVPLILYFSHSLFGLLEPKPNSIKQNL